MKRRIAIISLCVCMVMLQILDCCSVEVRAATDHTVYYSDFDKALSDRCIELQGYLKNTGTKQLGLLYSLRILCEYQLYVEFMGQYYKSHGTTEGLGIASKQVSMYEADLSERIGAFNKKFGSGGTGYEKLKLACSFTGQITGEKNENGVDNGSHKQCRYDVRKNLIETVPAYLKELLKGIQDEITQAKGDKDKVEQIKTDNTTLLTNIYQVYLACVNAESDLNSYTPFNSNDHQVTYSFKDEDGTKMKDALDKAVAPYDDLIDVAKDAMNEETEEEITVDLTESYVDNLSNAETNSQGVEIPTDAKLDPLYYAIMAASSVYVPLQSYAGSSEFQAALKSLTNDEVVQENMIEFYSATKDIRKPLYKREFDDSGYPTGTAKLMTIDDFFTDIKEGRSGSLCTVLGEFKYDGSSGSWIYEEGTDRTTVEFDYDDSENNADTELEESNSSGEDSESESTESSNESAGLDLGKVFASVLDVIPAVTAQAASKQVYYDDSKSAVIDANSGDDVTSSYSQDEMNYLKSSGYTSESNAFSSTKLKNLFSDDDDNDATDTETSDSGEDSEDDDNTDESDEDTEDAGEVLDEGSTETSTTDDTTLEDQAVYAYEEITDETKLSEPLLMYGTDYSRAIDNTTSMILSNIIKNSANLSYIDDQTTRYVYVNAYGDVVTDDNLIILPGIANPLLYNSDSKYSPYTAAFMNSYPVPFKKSSEFKLTSKQDIGKYLIVRQSSNKSSDTGTYAVLTDAIDSIKTTSPLTMVDFTTEFKLSGGNSNHPLTYNRLYFSDNSDSSTEYQYTPLCMGDSLQSDGVTIFPYVVAEDSGYGVAKTIASVMYTYLTTDAKSDGETANSSKFNENYILHNFLMSGLNGTNNPKGYTSSTLNQYNRFVSGSGERFLTKVMNLSETIMDTMSDVRGVIGLRDCMQNPVLGRILMFCRTNVMFFILAVCILLLFAFSKMKLDLFQVLVKLVACVIVAYLAITVIPTYLPMLFNVAINNVSETMSYKILATRTENESIGNVDSNALNEDGTSDLTNGSITLYRSGVLNYQDFVNSVNVDEDEIVGGNIEILNQEAGLFVEGDSIKISTSTLFDTLKIVDTPEDADGTTLHYLKAYKTVNNNVDYYTPYYQIVDSFLEKMNTLETVSEIPRSTITYSNGVTKDNFLVYSYVNSKPFLTPGSYDSDVVETVDSDDEVIKALKEEAAEYAEEMLLNFGDKNTASDFLGIADWLYNPDDAMKQTLWYQTMVDNNYYSKDGTVNQTKMDKLITYVNYQTKNFIYNMDGQIGKLSDETMTKIIAMRALVAFTQKVSEYGHWLYPFSLNYGEMTLGDVMSSVFISDYAQYTNNDMNVVDYIGYNKGWFHLIIFDFLVVILFVVVSVVQMLVYLMYVLLMVALVLKVLSQGNSMAPVKGFMKCAGLVMAGYTVLAIAFAAVNKANASTICIYVMLLTVVLVTYVLTLVISSLLGDLADVGNGAIDVKVASIASGTGLQQAFKNVKVNNLFSERTGRGRDGGFRDNRWDDYHENYDVYGFDSDIDDMYDSGGYYGGGVSSLGGSSASESSGEASKEKFDYDAVYDDLTVLPDGSDSISDYTADLGVSTGDDSDIVDSL